MRTLGFRELRWQMRSRSYKGHLMADLVGQRLGSYRLSRLLGRGGFASVYLAEHLSLHTQSAIKILHAHLDQETLDAFLREARHLSGLSHPQIVSLLDCAVEEDRPYLVMEYAPGGTLRRRHPVGTVVPLATCLSYITQIASALQHAHDHQLIHRDLKPENLLIGSHDQILLSDFGLALTIKSAEYLGVAALSGSLAYMAPEQLSGKPEAASDQYALALISYELLAGVRPFEGTLTEVCAQHLLTPPPPLRDTLPDLPSAIEETIFQALSKDPRSRFPNVHAFARALEQACSQKASHSLFPAPLPGEEENPKDQFDQPEEPAPVRFYQLPISPTSFIGREQVRKAASVLLVRPQVRLLTMVGVGGIGKTSLALSLAAGLAQTFTHGVCFVSLAPLTDPAQVIPAIAWTLGLREQGQTRLTESLKHFLHNKRLLLLLDNFEHLLEAAPHLADLLESCGQIKLLVTSRAVLHLRGEQIFPVPPLTLPDLGAPLDLRTLQESEAIQLFVERAQRVRPAFRLTKENAGEVAQICRRLDGLPLALELAAARLSVLSPAALRSRLNHNFSVLKSSGQDIPERQRTLRATLQWSYSLLSQEEQQLFRRISLFVDGVTVQALEALSATLGDDPSLVLDQLTALVEKSMLSQREQQDGELRFFMLEPLREFGLECLQEIAHEDHAVRQAHAAWCLAFIKGLNAIKPLLLFYSPVEQIEVEYANIRLALHTYLTQHHIKSALYLASLLTGFWFLRGTLSEGREILSQVITASLAHSGGEETRRLVLAIAYAGSFWLAYWQNDLVSAKEATQASLRLYRELGQERSIFALVHVLGVLEIEREGGNFQQGDAMCQQGTRKLRQLGDHATVAQNMMMQAFHCLHRGMLAQAQELSQQNLTLYKGLDHPWFTACTLHCLSWCHLLQGDHASALKRSEEALALFRAVGVPPFYDEALCVGADLHLALGDEQRARSLVEEAWRLGNRQGNQEYLVRALWAMGRGALFQGDYDQAQIHFEECVRKMAGMQYVERLQWALASSLEGLGEIALRQEQFSWAVRLFAAADTRRRVLGFYSPLGIQHPQYEQALSSLRATLGTEIFETTWEEGRVLTPLEALTARKPVRRKHQQTQSRTQDAFPAEARAAGLTKRELDVLRRLSQGQTNAQIAQDLVLSVVTVNSYLRNIYSKLGVTSRTQAMRYAIDHKLM